jgi:hypothetical protein
VTAELVAQVSIGQIVPTTASLLAQSLAELNSQLAGFLNIQAALTIQPPALDAQLQGCLQTAATIQAQIAAGITVSPPGVGLSVAANAAAMAELTAQITALLALQVTLGTAGVYVITHNGPSESHGPEVQQIVNDIAPHGNVVYSVTYLATAPEVFAALGEVLLTG